LIIQVGLQLSAITKTAKSTKPHIYHMIMDIIIGHFIVFHNGDFNFGK